MCLRSGIFVFCCNLFLFLEEGFFVVEMVFGICLCDGANWNRVTLLIVEFGVGIEMQQLLLEAIHTGMAEGFYKLISNFQTQSEPAYCGLATLAMVLNALAIDPGRKWKGKHGSNIFESYLILLCFEFRHSTIFLITSFYAGPWRWFDESMLDCCESLEVVKERGISFGKLVCLAQCSGAKVEAFRASRSSVDEFRRYVIQCSKSEDCHLVVSYHRATLKQVHTMTGS